MSDLHILSLASVIELNDVEFCWPNSPQSALNIKQLSVKRGEHLFIKGPSGCGKSTLLSLLTGINQAQHGRVSILGTDLSALTSRQRDKFRADHIGYIFQQFNLLPYLSVIENVILPCQFSAIRKQQVEGDMAEKAKQLLTRLHLTESLFTKPVIELSIGQQQRVAAARALIGEPQLIIADEPTSALDHDNRLAFIELLLEEANHAGSTLVFVSHDPTLESLFNRSIHLPQLNQAGETA
ncbi:ABC transporter ATP-binding protein [Vibrio aestuarianus]|uniref:ABC transporter ATP-binding protein n=1 Tax=Vibrio aestuarianus TaxID=28171 RepID=A0A9X4IZD9_9VIBR|nr:ABC transporter ATP-binding protein [Vibrio aestuarianus]MDE1233808.1 ABC transporter ATP-binding protein [Vibrio aestuarianus]MDE1244686.1 ABC transporter ATP-binding protein [Vibrio aestuarianus]MDE1345796.1 ABC transporter ATP-binding protein [Vibrio aestuarianus]NGZ61858.1 ABC transporter ATP-binding protein [Vibrio aestuarianus subsp. cardii]